MCAITFFKNDVCFLCSVLGHPRSQRANLIDEKHAEVEIVDEQRPGVRFRVEDMRAATVG